MKNMLFIAGIATFSFAALLAWADQALVHYLEKPASMPAPDSMPALHLPEVVISANKGMCAPTTQIP